MLTVSGWVVQTKDKINLSAAAMGELSFKTGEPDHALFVDGKVIGSAEASPKATLSLALRRNQPSMSPAGRSHSTLQENTRKRSDLDDFVNYYFGEVRSARRADRTPQRGIPTMHNRVETERFKSFTCEDLIKRDKVSLDIFWLKDDALEEPANPPSLKSSPSASHRTWKRRWSGSQPLRRT